jgi:hypothetical protein
MATIVRPPEHHLWVNTLSSQNGTGFKDDRATEFCGNEVACFRDQIGIVVRVQTIQSYPCFSVELQVMLVGTLEVILSGWQGAP